MDKITVIPEDVRGLGNIVSPKSTGDFNVSDGTISSASDSTYGTVYSLSYLTGSYLVYGGSRWVTPSDTTFSVSVTLKKHSDDSAISSVSVSCLINDTTTLTATTNSSGVASFSIPVTDGLCEYKLLFKYAGTNSIAGCFVGALVHTGSDSFDLDLIADKNIIQTDENSILVASVTGTDCNGETVGVAGQTVYFYEEYVLGVRLTGSASIIQSGETSVLTGQLIDTEDGSLVRKSGETVYFYNITDNGILINEPTEHTLTGNQYVTLYEVGLGLSDWKLSFDYKANAESRLFIGKKSGLASNPTNSLFVGTPNGTNKTYYGYRDTSTHATDISSSDPTSYKHMSIGQTGEDTIFNIDGTDYTISSVPISLSNSTLVIGLTIWGSDDTKSVNVKNLKLEVF